MIKYKYVLRRKYPFIIKRELTELELIHSDLIEYLSLLPILYIIIGIAVFIGFISSIRRKND